MALRYNERTGEFEEVRDFPQIIEFKAQTQTIFEGESYLVKWKVENATIVEIDSERVDSSIGQKEFLCDFSGTKRITLVARNGSDVISQYLPIDALPKPSFNLSCSASKIRRNSNEKSIISWNIEYAVSAQISIDNRKEDIILSGNKEIMPTENTVIRFTAVSLDYHTVFTDECIVEVFNAGKVSFACNKKFSFASLPVVLSWETKDCFDVELVGFGEQPLNGSKIVCPEITTDYVLIVTDNFGTQEYSLKVQMLPLPIIRSVLVEAPKLEHVIPISYKTPQFVMVPSIPTFENEFSKLELPQIPNMKKVELISEGDMNVSTPQRNRLSKKIYKLLNHIFKI